MLRRQLTMLLFLALFNGLVVFPLASSVGTTIWLSCAHLPRDGVEIESVGGTHSGQAQKSWFRAGVRREIEVRGEKHLCGPSRPLDDLERYTVTHDPERPELCRLTDWVGRLSWDEWVLLTILALLILSQLLALRWWIRWRRSARDAMEEPLS